MSTLEGTCLCKAVAYEAEDEFESAFYCHCADCRRATGSAFKPMARIGADKVRIIRGGDALLIYGTPPGSNDVHCGKCGSFLYSFIAEGGFCHVAMGTLVDAPAIKPSFHMFVASKAPWFEIADELPQFDRFPE